MTTAPILQIYLLKFVASFQQQVQTYADPSHISNEDIPDITHISDTPADSLAKNVTHIWETEHYCSKLSKDSGNYYKNIFIY